MTPRRAALVGIVFLLIAGFYWAFPYLVDVGRSTTPGSRC